MNAVAEKFATKKNGKEFEEEHEQNEAFEVEKEGKQMNFELVKSAKKSGDSFEFFEFAKSGAAIKSG